MASRNFQALTDHSIMWYSRFWFVFDGFWRLLRSLAVLLLDIREKRVSCNKRSFDGRVVEQIRSDSHFISLQFVEEEGSDRLSASFDINQITHFPFFNCVDKV
jgi:hypothetical protein